MKIKKAFTLIELVFVIVVLGILAAVAFPKLAPIRTDAEIANGKAQVMTIRAAINNERQRRLILGDNTYITAANLDTPSGLFGGVLATPLSNNNKPGSWHTTTTGNGVYQYNVMNVDTQFDYNETTGSFDCTQAGSNHCDDITD